MPLLCPKKFAGRCHQTSSALSQVWKIITELRGSNHMNIRCSPGAAVQSRWKHSKTHPLLPSDQVLFGPLLQVLPGRRTAGCHSPGGFVPSWGTRITVQSHPASAPRGEGGLLIYEPILPFQTTLCSECLMFSDVPCAHSSHQNSARLTAFKRVFRRAEDRQNKNSLSESHSLKVLLLSTVSHSYFWGHGRRQEKKS